MGDPWPPSAAPTPPASSACATATPAEEPRVGFPSATPALHPRDARGVPPRAGRGPDRLLGAHPPRASDNAAAAAAARAERHRARLTASAGCKDRRQRAGAAARGHARQRPAGASAPCIGEPASGSMHTHAAVRPWSDHPAGPLQHHQWPLPTPDTAAPASAAAPDPRTAGDRIRGCVSNMSCTTVRDADATLTQVPAAGRACCQRCSSQLGAERGQPQTVGCAVLCLNAW